MILSFPVVPALTVVYIVRLLAVNDSMFWPHVL